MIRTPVYCRREDVKRSLDIKETARNNAKIDRAIESAARKIDGHLHRKFYPEDKTVLFDWPNYQRAYPWRIWFDGSELADTTINVPVVTSGGNVINAADIFWGPWNYAPPFTFLELNRATPASFGQGATPQRDVSIAGTFGYSTETDPAGTLTASMDTTAATAAVSDSSLVGVGSILIAGSERMLVADRAMTDTSVAFTGSLTTDSAADNLLTVADSSLFGIDEVLRADAERLLVVDILPSDVLVVKRAWDGTVLATHTSGTLYASRSLTVVRGALGTAAASHSNGDALTIHRVPPVIRDLAIAESGSQVLSETGGYTDPQGEAGASISGLGASLADLWDEAETVYGRKNRSRVV